MNWWEYFIILIGIILSPIWLPILAIANLKKCPHFYTDCPGSYAFWDRGKTNCGMFNARHNCLHYHKLEAEKNALAQWEAAPNGGFHRWH